MAELHYKDSAVWRKIKELWYRDGGAWRKIKELWYRDGGVWRKVFVGGFSSFSMTFHSVSGQPDLELEIPGFSSYTLYPTGQFTGGYSDPPTDDIYEDYAGEWASPIDPSGVAGAAYECMFTVVSSNINYPDGVFNVWQSLSTAKGFNLQGPLYRATASATVNIKVRRADDLTVVIDQNVSMSSTGTTVH